MKRLFLLSLFTSLMFITSTVYGKFIDVPQDFKYSNEINRLTNLGVINGTSDITFSPDQTLTREQFSTLIVKISGLEKIALNSNNKTYFSDVPITRWSNQYINTAVDKGYLKGMVDGLFHPSENITFGQASTVLIKALGYTDKDLTGFWPYNYIEKTKELDISKDLDFGASENLPRWAAAVMIERVLFTNMNVPIGVTNTTLAEFSGIFSEAIVLDNSLTSSNLQKNEILTTTGVYIFNGDLSKLQLGKKYDFILDNDVILSYAQKSNLFEELTVVSSVTNKILATNHRTNANESFFIPENILYYYDGNQINFNEVSSKLKQNSSIILVKNSDNTKYEYGVIFSPIYSNPFRLEGSTLNNNFETLLLNDDSKIIKNDIEVNKSQLTVNEVIYEVTDIWENNKYILAIDNEIEGVISEVSPSVRNPELITIHSTTYSISKDFDLTKLDNFSNYYQNEDTISLILGANNEIIDINEDNSNIAFIVNGSTQIIEDSSTGEKERVYYVNLLTINGSNLTLKTTKSYAGFKGSIVNYILKKDNYVNLSWVYTGKYEDIFIDKTLNKIDSNYIDSNVKIFNILKGNSSQPATIQSLTFNDLAHGLTSSDKIKYIRTYGDFDDIKLLVFHDYFDDNNPLGLISEITARKFSSSSPSITYSVLVHGNEYSYRYENSSLKINGVYKVKLLLDTITDDELEFIEPTEIASSIQAINSKKIKINHTIYLFNDEPNIYYIKKTGTRTSLGIKDLRTLDFDFETIEIYLDKPTESGGKVEFVLLKQ